MSKEMKVMKERLYSKYGLRCEVCGEKLKRKELTGHHVVMRSKGGKVTEDNILIACYHCHFVVINNLEYDSEEYWALMEKSLKHRKEQSTS